MTQPGNRRQQVFFKPSDYALHRDVLAERCRKASVEVWAYCLMPNHVHLVLTPQSPDGLARAIGETHREYTGFVNARGVGAGTCFRGASPRLRSTTRTCWRRHATSRSIRCGRGWSSARAYLAGQDDALVRVAPLIERVGRFGDLIEADADRTAGDHCRRADARCSSRRIPAIVTSQAAWAFSFGRVIFLSVTLWKTCALFKVRSRPIACSPSLCLKCSERGVVVEGRVRGILAAIGFATLVLNGGCAIVDKELNNRGGYLDYLADEHWFKADSKKMRALRAFALEASLARIASVSPKNDQDRQLMAIRIGSTSMRAQYVLSCAFDQNPLPVSAAKNDPCFYFDSLMVDYTTALLDLAMVAFPIEDTKNLLNFVTGATLTPAAALDILQALLNLGREALKYGRVLGAIYRDTIELEVQVWLATPRQDQTFIPPSYRIDNQTVAALKTVYDRGNDDMVAWQLEIAALRARGLEPIPDRKFIYELSSLISYLCGLITADIRNGSLATCVANLPSPPGTNASPKTASWVRPGNSLVWRSLPLARKPAAVQTGPVAGLNH